MIKTIIKIRLLQLYRLMKDIGILRIIFVVLLVVFTAFIAMTAIRKTENNTLITIISTILLLSIHSRRKDKSFLKITGEKPYFIYLTEYLLIMFPLLLCCIFMLNWKEFSYLIVLCILIPLTSAKTGHGKTFSFLKLLMRSFSSVYKSIRNVKIPIKNPFAFEWVSGIRGSYFFIVPFYILILSFSFKSNVAPIGIIIFSIMIGGFYLYGESREFIELYASNAKEFMLRKIRVNLKYLLILFIPVVVIYLFYEPSTWYLMAGAVMISCVIQILSIIFKYGLFKENSDLSRNGMIGMLNIVFILVPFFWPVPLIMGIRYYIKGQNKLKKYFDDTN
jgi:hypothetical protein